jgi:ParB family chromosome partitioning protein
MAIDVGLVAMVEMDKIIIGDRARKDMGDITGLRDNMRETGLIGPLAMKDLHNGTYELLAGGRRITVLKEEGNTIVPARIYDRELTELEMKIIEKSENFHRKEMEFWEMDALTAEIHELKQQLYGKATPGPSKAGWTKADTALELGVDRMTVTNSLQRNKLRTEHPEIFLSCKTASDADKLIKKVTKAVETNILAKQIESSKSNTTIHSIISRYIIKSAFEGMHEIPDEVHNFVELDPPYAIKLQNVKQKPTGISQYVENDYNEITADIYIEGSKDPNHPWKGMRTMFKECYRVLKPNSWMICWFAPAPWFETMYQEIINAGFETTRMCGIWTKGQGQSNQPNIRLANSYEMFFYAWKGNPELNKPGTINTYNVPPVPPTQKTHLTEKPVELMKEIYSTFIPPGSNIVIPFLGSGNGIFAAYQLGIDAIGFDLTKSFKDSFIVKAHNGIGYLR